MSQSGRLPVAFSQRHGPDLCEWMLPCGNSCDVDAACACASKRFIANPHWLQPLNAWLPSTSQASPIIVVKS